MSWKMMRIALRCSDSSAFVCAAVTLECHTGHAYSNTDRITVMSTVRY